MGLQSLGGSMPAGRPVAVHSGGRTHVFAIAAGGVMNHWTSNGAEWSAPSPLPGGNLAPSFPCAIALGGSVHVFAIGNGGAPMRWSSTDGTIWTFHPCPFLWPVPGGGNGLAAASMDGKRIDLFAVTAGGIVQYSFSPAMPPLPPAMAALPGSSGLFTSVLAAVSSGPNTLDVFAIDKNTRMPVRWHFDGAWTQPKVLGGPALHHPNAMNGFAAVSPAPGRVELFAITADARITNWSITGTTFQLKLLAAGSGSLPDGVPEVVARPGGKLDLFAIGPAPNPFTGGPLVHWRFDGKWSDPREYDANLAAGGVGAAHSPAAGVTDAFAFNAGTNNSLQHWPAGIGGSSKTPWSNWANNQQSSPNDPVNTLEGHCYPTCLDELVAIVRTAAQQNKRVRAVGSSWSFSDVAIVRPGYVIETNRLDKLIPDTIVPNALLAPHATSPQPHHLIHVEAGIQLEKLMTILDGVPPARAPYTLGGATGQTLAGVLSTSVHGSHFRLPPFPDWVRAIHLVGPDGKQHWIEPKDRPITDQTKLQGALGSDVQIHYDDDWFDAALVTVGGLGIIYSVVFQVKEQYKLTETITPIKWLDLKKQIGSSSWFATLGNDVEAVQVAIDPGSMGSSNPDCYLSTRVTAPMSKPTSGSSSFDPLGAFCEGNLIIDLLFLAANELGKPQIIVPTLALVLPTIPALVAVAALFPPVLAVLGVAATIAATTAAAIPGLVGLLRAGGPGAVGDVVAAVLDKRPELTAIVVRELTKFAQPPGERTNIAHQLMAPWNKGECAARGLALEVAFDMADQSHVQYLDAALAMLKDEAAMGRILGGYFAIRFVGKSRAILSPQKSDMTCMVEVTGLRGFSSTKPLLARLETLGRSFGGVQHWAMFADCRYEDVARGFPRLDTWLRVQQQITSGGAVHTFDNAFMDRCGLIPTAKPRMLLRHASDGAINVIYGGAKFHVPDPATLNALFAGIPVRDAQAGELEHIGRVPGDGTLLHEATTGKVFVIFGGARFHVPDWPTLNRLFPGFLLRPLWGGALDHIPDRPADGSLLREENGTIWITFGGAKFQVPDPAKELPAYAPHAPATVNRIFGRYLSSRGPLRQLWNGALAGIPLIPADGTFFGEENSPYYVIEGGRKAIPGRLRRGEPPRIIHVLWQGALAQIP